MTSDISNTLTSNTPFFAAAPPCPFLNATLQRVKREETSGQVRCRARSDKPTNQVSRGQTPPSPPVQTLQGGSFCLLIYWNKREGGMSEWSWTSDEELVN
ncbi:hypothetical protein CDAR_465991 [Caerostris darwini]|uniref:Uncharacterized protein n=1 Tax=Caerostris darwini TaxID=1538125 RepID=A0AAV4WP82_9ARAC|nr:hypothetical protein CDAR_465991 [Caerostris darwini]